MKLYVAVVDDPGRSYASIRPRGDWACFVGEDKDRVVRSALEARRAWGGQYRVLVGELAGEVREPVAYDVIPFEDAEERGQ